MTQIRTYKYFCGKLSLTKFLIMYFNTLVILFITFCAVAPLKFEEYKYPGACPKVKYIVDLNFSQILGFWYRCFSTLDTNSCVKNDGQTAYAYPFNSTVAGVAICCPSEANRGQVTCDSDVGTGFIRPLSEAGRFSYEFDGQSYLNVILDADDNSVIFYGCKSKQQKLPTERRDEQIFIYARSYQQCKSLERQSRRVLEQNGISWSSVKTVTHGSSIPYTPVPQPCPKN